MSGVKKKFSLARWGDEWLLAARGIAMSTKNPKFWAGFAPSFLIFGTLMNLLSGGFSKFELMGALGFPASLQIIGSSLIGLFGINMAFLNWLPVFLIALLQGVLIGLIVLLWDKKRAHISNPNKSRTDSSADENPAAESSKNSANVEKAGLITGLIALGAGCPTCGTTLLTPLLGALFSTGSFAIAGAISTVVTILAVIIALLSLKRLGEEAYVTIVNERYLKKKESHGRKSTH